MNVEELREECQVVLERVDIDTTVDQSRGTERRSVSADAATRSTRGEGEMPPPGPACSKVRHGARTKGQNTGTSCTSKAAAALQAKRKSKRQASLDSNRFAVLATADQEDEDQPTMCVDSDESEYDPGHTEKEKPPLKRRMTKGENDEEWSSTEEVLDKKRGRPQTTGFYVGRGDARERDNKLKKEALELDIEKRIRSLSSRQIRETHKASVEDKLDELDHAPSVDLAHRARESMAEVWRIASISKNLKGTCVHSLKQAAAVRAASMELLSHRAENNDPEGDALKQIKSLRRELEQTKHEAQAAKEEAAKAKQEAEKLRKEMTEVKGSGRPRRRARPLIEDSPTPSPFPPLPQDTREDDAAESIASTGEMEVDDLTPNTEPAEAGEQVPPEAKQDPPEYCDARRKAEILPPREEWPNAVRPPIQGKIKILEDGILTGTRVKMVKGTRASPGPGQQSNMGPRHNEAQTLMDLLAPMLKEWLRTNLSSLGLAGAAVDSGKGDTRPANKEKKGKKNVPNTPHPLPVKVAEEKDGRHPTGASNRKPWSAVVGSKSGGDTQTTLPTEQRSETREQKKSPAATTSNQEAWIEVSGRKKKKAKKNSPKEAKPADGKSRQKGQDAAGQT